MIASRVVWLLAVVGALLSLVIVTETYNGGPLPEMCREKTTLTLDRSALGLAPGEIGSLRAMTVDSERGIFLAPLFSHSIIAKGTVEPLSFTAALSTSPHSSILTAALNSNTGLAYFTTELSGTIIILDYLFFSSVTVVDVTNQLTPPNGDNPGLWSSAIDDFNNVGYFATVGGEILKITLSSFTVVGRCVTGQPVRMLHLDRPSGILYASSNNGYVLKIQTSTMSQLNSRLYATRKFTAGAIDVAGGFLYLASLANFESTVTRVHLSTFTSGPADVIFLDSPTTRVARMVVDTSTQKLIMGTEGEDSGEVEYSLISKLINIDVSTFTVVGDIQLDDGEISVLGLEVIDGAILSACSYENMTLSRYLQPTFNCSTVTTCNECRSACGCGWCAISQTCVEGDPRGSFASALCPAGDDEWEYYSCYNCHEYTNCDGCLLQTSSSTPPPASGISSSPCGWCGEEAACVRALDGTAVLNLCDLPAWETATCPRCDTHDTCSECAADPECGWCPRTSTCVPGNETTPYATTCESYTFSECPACSHTSCDACTADASCVWCDKDLACAYGNAAGPFDLTCADELWSYGECKNCSSLTCDACTASPFCGWCADSKTCLEGDSSGPYMAGPSECAAGTALVWEYGSSAFCTECSSLTSCSACATDSPHSNCGWCASSSTCLLGSTAGPLGSLPCSTSEGGWEFGGSAFCTECSSATSCDACASLGGGHECGWCASTGSCLRGSSTGPFSPSTCPDGIEGAWEFGLGAFCGDCSLATSCDSCTAMGDGSECGWCETTASCMGGTSEGPFTVAACPSASQGAWEFGASAHCVNCSALSSCSSCNDPSHESNCVWCPGSLTCVAGSPGGGPFTPHDTCGVDWQSTPACTTCPSGNVTCSECTAVENCGYCAVTGSCLRGQANGPFAGPSSAAECDWEYGSCIECPSSSGGGLEGGLESCTLCSGVEGCGWCAGTAECVRGNASNPYAPGADSCPFDWSTTNCTACSEYTTCEECSSFPYCGYCASTGSCVSADPTTLGPAAGVTCPVFDYHTCRNCEAHSGDCSNCTSTPSCVFCPVSGDCVAGESTGPYVAAGEESPPLGCTGSGNYRYRSCAACTYSDCESCSSDTSCGWCEGSRTCSAGDALAPYIGTCADGSWTLPCLPCAQASDCETCVAADSRCGWCAAEWACLVGSTAGSSYASACSDGGSAWDYGTCTSCDGLSGGGADDSQGCSTSCTATEGCGWCVGTQECLRGNASVVFDPEAVACPDETWSYGACPLCSTHDSCSECTNDAMCGWCVSTSTCTEGLASGPANGSCPVWDFASCVNTEIATCHAVPSDESSCTECLDVGYCAFCAETGVCYAAVEDVECATLDVTECRPHCVLANGTSCLGCLGRSPLCGWCNATSSCVSDDEAVSCSSTWILSQGDCEVDQIVDPPKDECEAFSDDCEWCLENGCVWARGSDSCVTLAAGASTKGYVIRPSGCPDSILFILLLVLAVLCLLCCLLGALWFFLLRGRKKGTDDVKVEPQPTQPVVEKQPIKFDEEEPLVVSPVNSVNTSAAKSPPPKPSSPPPTTVPVALSPPVTMTTIDIVPRPWVELCARDSALEGVGAKLSATENLLLQENLFLATALTRVVSVTQDGDELSRALVTVFNAADLGPPLLSSLIATETASFSESPATFFRENSLASKFLTTFAALEGGEWLFNTLSPLVAYVSGLPEPLVPPVADYTESAGSEVLSLLSVVDMCLNHIFAAGKTFPPSLRLVCRHLMDEAEAVGGEASRIALGNFVFLRFINPALCAPMALPLCASVPSPLATRNLTGIAKILQALASKSSFIQKNRHLINCNPYITANAPRITAWLRDLSVVGGAVSPPSVTYAAPSLKSRGLPPTLPPRTLACRVLHVTPPKARDEALAAVYNLVVKYIEELRIEMNAVIKKGGVETRGGGKPFDMLRLELASDQPSDVLLLNMILEDDVSIAAALCHVVAPEQQAELTIALMDVFEANEQGLRLLKAITASELTQASSAGGAFRSFHMAAKLMVKHATLIGSDYRARVMGPSVRYVLDHPTEFEIDPDHLSKGQSAKANLDRLLELVSTLLDTVFASLPDIPIHMRIMAEHLTTEMKRRFRHEWYLGPGRYFFDHFLCEALRSPHVLGEVDVPAPAAARALKLVHAVLSSLVTGMELGVEHRFVRPLNAYIASNLPVMRQFLHNLSLIPPEAPFPWPAHVPYEASTAALAHLRFLLKFYVENSDFVFYYHFFYYKYHNPDGSDIEEAPETARDVGDTLPTSPEAQVFLAMERVILGEEVVDEADVQLVEGDGEEEDDGRRGRAGGLAFVTPARVGGGSR